MIYGAIPNIGSTISQAMGFADQQSAENPAFGQWWNSSAGQSLKQLLSQVDTMTHLFGDEIVFGYSQGVPGSSEKLPMIFAEVQTGKQADVTAALNTLTGQMGASSLPYRLTDSLMILSDSQNTCSYCLAIWARAGQLPSSGRLQRVISAASAGCSAWTSNPSFLRPALLAGPGAISSAPTRQSIFSWNGGTRRVPKKTR